MHPDKICDLISDTILDNAIEQDSNPKMAVEATIKDDLIYGEANTKAKIDYVKIAKKLLKKVGYKEEYHVIVKVNNQSKEIEEAVESKETKKFGAGNQGIIFGYACSDTDVYMPTPIYYANFLAKRLYDFQRQSEVLGPDGKTQVSVEYDDDKMKRIDTIVISTQHTKGISRGDVEKLVKSIVILNSELTPLIDRKTSIIVNPSGSFVIGGSLGNSGTTGRKIVCDTYGGMRRVGGGCLSSKDPTKADRSDAYYCRYVAKNIVAHKMAKKYEIEVSYIIGKSDPVSIFIDTFSTQLIDIRDIYRYVFENFDFSVSNMIDELDLRRPIYSKTSCYGHFEREEFSWENIKPI